MSDDVPCWRARVCGLSPPLCRGSLGRGNKPPARAGEAQLLLAPLPLFGAVSASRVPGLGEQHCLPPSPSLPTCGSVWAHSPSNEAVRIGVEWFISVMRKGCSRGSQSSHLRLAATHQGLGALQDVPVVLGKLLPTYSLRVQPRICPRSGVKEQVGRRARAGEGPRWALQALSWGRRGR